MIPLGLGFGFLLLSGLISICRSALTRVDQKADEDAFTKRKVLQGALNAVLKNPATTTFTLLSIRLVFDGIAIGAMTIYLLNTKISQTEFVGTFLGVLALVMATPGLLNPISRQYSKSIALLTAPLVLIVDFITRPINRPLYKLSQWFSGGSETLPELATELAARFNRVLIPLDKEVNPPDEQELAMIYAILHMEETAVRDVMIPRPDLITIETSEPISKAVALMREAGHSRILVYEETIDHVVGILHARDLLRLAEPTTTVVTMDELLRPALFVPEGKRLDALLREFQRQRAHMAVVVDEYGGTSGLVTLEDILEEIVGEIIDEFDAEEQGIQVISKDEVIMDAKVNISFLKEQFGVDVEGDGFDTIGGLVYHQLGKIPIQGDQAVKEGLHIEVLRTEGRRITKVRVLRKTITTNVVDHS